MSAMTHEKRVECVQEMIKRGGITWESIQEEVICNDPLDHINNVIDKLESQLENAAYEINRAMILSIHNTDDMSLEALYWHEIDLISKSRCLRRTQKDLDVYEYAIAGVEAELARLGTASDSIG